MDWIPCKESSEVTLTVQKTHKIKWWQYSTVHIFLFFGEPLWVFDTILPVYSSSSLLVVTVVSRHSRGSYSWSWIYVLETLLPNCMSSSFFICIFFPRTFFLCKKSSESWDRRWENTCYRVKNVRQSLRSCYPQHHNLLNKFGTFVVITLTRSKSSSKSRILSSFRWAIRSFRSSMAILSAISSSAVCNKKGFGVIINE